MTRDYIDKILNPQSKQDIFDTVPAARKLFDNNPSSGKVSLLQKRSERKEKLINNAKEHFAKMLDRRIREIEGNIK